MIKKLDGCAEMSENRNCLSHGKWTLIAPSRYSRNSLSPARGLDNYVFTGEGVSVPRKSTGKRMRFEVFKRDGFTCRYCGATPPEAVLVLDHIVPVVDGGDTTIDNLNTSCEPCNQGKAGRPLGLVQPRPDADLLYLETQQEIAELRRYHAALSERETVAAALIEALQDLWCEEGGLDWHPAPHVLRPMLNRYGPEILEAAVRDVAPKVGSGYTKRNQWDRYMWAVMRNLAGVD